MVFSALILVLSLFFSGDLLVASSAYGDGLSGLKNAPSRIVSLYAGHSESLLAMGYGNLLVGISDSDDPSLFPEAVRLPQRVDPETIIALNPDLVLSRPMLEKIHGKSLDAVRRAGIPVVSLDPPVWSRLEEYVSSLCEIVGSEKNDILIPFRERLKSLEHLAEVRRCGARKKVFFLETGGRGIRTCSPDSWAARIMEAAGGENGASDAKPIGQGSPLANYGLERVLSLSRKGLDFYIIQHGAMNDVEIDSVESRGWMKGLGDVEVVFIEERDLSRPSLYRVETSIRRLIDVFYPEK